MIIEKPIAAGDTVTLKITTGEEVVARLSEIKADSYLLSKPLVVMATQQGIGLGPFSFTVNPEAKIPVNKSQVVFITKTDTEMAKQYIASTTGIQT